MASSFPPKKNTAYTLFCGLVSQADTKVFQSSPTIAAGDVKVSIDDGATFANLTNLPAVVAGSVKVVAVELTAAEMNADKIIVKFEDAAGAQWCDALFEISTAESTLDEQAAAIWSYVSRTLTQTAAQVAAALDGDDITCLRGDTLTINFTGLGDISTRTKLYFTVKQYASDTDAEALIQIEETDGLKYFQGAAATTPANGSITVTNQVTGAVTVVLAAAETALLATGKTYAYDVQMVTASTVLTLTQGKFMTTADSTRAVS